MNLEETFRGDSLFHAVRNRQSSNAGFYPGYLYIWVSDVLWVIYSDGYFAEVACLFIYLFVWVNLFYLFFIFILCYLFFSFVDVLLK